MTPISHIINYVCMCMCACVCVYVCVCTCVCVRVCVRHRCDSLSRYNTSTVIFNIKSSYSTSTGQYKVIIPIT